MAQLGAYDLAVSPAGTASKVLNVVFCHVASLEQWNAGVTQQTAIFLDRSMDAAQTNALDFR
jgi:hypothetical protein